MSTSPFGKRPKRARILLVDDHPLVREGMALLLSRQADMELCGGAEGVADAEILLEKHQPDLLIVDLVLKDGHGLELARQAKSRNPALIVLIQSMYDESLYAQRALQAGASGYVNKQEAPEKLLTAIRSVLSGRVYFSASTLQRLTGGAADSDSSPIRRDVVDLLSDRELQVFELIGQGMTTRKIAAQLKLSVHTIDTHREKLKAKLKLHNSAELTQHAVRWVLEHGK